VGRFRRRPRRQQTPPVTAPLMEPESARSSHTVFTDSSYTVGIVAVYRELAHLRREGPSQSRSLPAETRPAACLDGPNTQGGGMRRKAGSCTPYWEQPEP
jgi:hypothetical protein